MYLSIASDDLYQKIAQKVKIVISFFNLRSIRINTVDLVVHTCSDLSLSLCAENKAIGVMRPGHTFTIEPMISEGTWRDVTWPDNWTAVTQVGLTCSWCILVMTSW